MAAAAADMTNFDYWVSEMPCDNCPAYYYCNERYKQDFTLLSCGETIKLWFNLPYIAKEEEE